MSEKPAKVNFSDLTTDVISEILRGKIYEIARNKKPWGVFLIRKPQTEEEIERLVELLREIVSEKK